MRKLIISLMFLLSVNAVLSAQTRVFDENISSDKDSVTVTFKVDSNKGVPSRYKEIIMPYIFNGKDTLWFDVVEVYGKGRFKRERQEKYYSGDRDWELSDNQTLAKTVYAYESKVPVKRWMKSASFGLKRHLTGCNCEKDFTDDLILASAQLYEEPVVEKPVVVETPVKKPMIRMDFGKDEMEIVFKVSKIEIDSTVFDNEVTFGKILASIDKIYSDSLYRVERIEVAGYASPEGPPDFNDWLGINRAKALIDYIIKQRPQYGLTEDNFVIRNGEENWEGLRRVLAQSDMPEKDAVIAIIDNEDISNEGKKLMIEKMDYGWVWHKMLKQIYPRLRCARYLSIYYGPVEIIQE